MTDQVDPLFTGGQPNNGRPERYTKEEVIAALKDAMGIQTIAARRLGCSRETIANYMKRYAVIKKTAVEARESLKDVAEAELIKQIQNGNMTAIIFFLKTQAKDRGYIERTDVAGQHQVELKENWREILFERE